jgi:hypothetical protein
MKVDDLIKIMQVPLASDAYKKHGGKSFLTSIDATYTRERLTEIFGPYGIGWGVDWSPDNAKDWMTQTTKGKDRYHFALMQADFWFMLDGERVSFPVTGYSDNDNLGDAMEGARTNAVSSGAKALLFQLHVYKNAPAPSPQQRQSTPARHWSETADNRNAIIAKLTAASKTTHQLFKACGVTDWADMARFEGTGKDALAAVGITVNGS